MTNQTTSVVGSDMRRETRRTPWPAVGCNKPTARRCESRRGGEKPRGRLIRGLFGASGASTRRYVGGGASNPKRGDRTRCSSAYRHRSGSRDRPTATSVEWGPRRNRGTLRKERFAQDAPRARWTLQTSSEERTATRRKTSETQPATVQGQGGSSEGDELLRRVIGEESKHDERSSCLSRATKHRETFGGARASESQRIKTSEGKPTLAIT